MAKKQKFATNYAVRKYSTTEPITRGKGNVVQNYPSLGELLIRFKNGEDISPYVNSPVHTSDLNFTNKVGKVDITEIEEHVREKVGDANRLLAQLQARQRNSPVSVATETERGVGSPDPSSLISETKCSGS